MVDDAPHPEHSPSPTPREHSIERLLAVLEKAEKPSRDIDWEIAELVAGPPPADYVGIASAKYFTSSVDDALTLVPAGARVRELGQWWDVDKPGGWYCNVMRWEWTDGVFGAGLTERAYTYGFAEDDYHGMPRTAPTAALALCIAALKARSAK